MGGAGSQQSPAAEISAAGCGRRAFSTRTETAPLVSAPEGNGPPTDGDSPWAALSPRRPPLTRRLRRPRTAGTRLKADGGGEGPSAQGPAGRWEGGRTGGRGLSLSCLDPGPRPPRLSPVSCLLTGFATLTPISTRSPVSVAWTAAVGRAGVGPSESHCPSWGPRGSSPQSVGPRVPRRGHAGGPLPPRVTKSASASRDNMFKEGLDPASVPSALQWPGARGSPAGGWLLSRSCPGRLDRRPTGWAPRLT